MTTMSGGREFHDELTTWLEQVKAAQGGIVNLRHISVPTDADQHTIDADQHTIDAAIIVLSAKKAKACIPSTAAEYQADIDQLLERRSALSATA